MSLIEIRPPASLEEYHQACGLVEDVYYERITNQRHTCHHPKAIFVAVRDHTMIGSVGFRSADQGTLPAEHYFGFDLAEVCSLPRAAVFEIVKLAAADRTQHTVFRGLLAACFHYAFAEKSFGMGLAIVKPKLQKALNSLLQVPTRQLPYQFVPERTMDYPRYFCERRAPVPVTSLRADRDAYLGQMLADLAGKATVRTCDFDHQRDYSAASSYIMLEETALAA